MITFRLGPAAGKYLDLLRAPLLLRVVIDRDGTVDALDQPDDQAKPTETIHVYARVGEVIGRGFACSRGRGCRPVVIAEYVHCLSQPDDADARDNARWQAWAEKAAAELANPQASSLKSQASRGPKTPGDEC